VVSHRPAPPEATDKQTFVTSIEAGIETARAAAGDRDIAIMGGVLPRLLSAAVWGEDPDLTPPRPPAYAEDGGDLCYVKDCGRAIALLTLAERLNHGTYNVSTGRLVRNSEVVAAINAAVPGADVALPEGRDPHRPPDNYLDTTRLLEDTGFRPEYDVERAVPDYVGWLRRHDR
jgi:UDP-glucose 4-epimerase